MRAVLLFLLLSLPIAAAAAPDPALESARAALADERWDDALVAAAAVLRDDPTAYESLLVKALAYEGRGELDRAESLLVTFQELAVGKAVAKEANAALDRVRAAGRGVVRGEGAALAGGEVERLVASVGAAVEDGRCGSALADARLLVDAVFDSPASWALLGDARRCAGNKRGAVDAYRRARALGSDDPGVLVVLRGLEASFGELRVRVAVDQAIEVPRVLLRIGDVERAPDFRRGGENVFRDLDSPEPMTVVVRGLGLEEQVRALQPLAPGERRRLEIRTRYVGVGRLTVGTHEPSQCRVEVREDRLEVAGGGTVEVTAGLVPVFVQNEFGTLRHEVWVDEGAALELDPLPLVPSTLTVVGLPVGAVVRAYVDGAHGTFAEAELRVAATQPMVDPDTGVWLAPPVKLGPLMGGSGGLFLEHARLGDAAVDVSLQPGRVNATTFRWEALDGVDDVSAEFRRWKESQEGRRSRRAGPWLPPVIVGAVASLGAAALGVAGLQTDSPPLQGAAAGTGVGAGVAFGMAIGIGVASPRHEPWAAWRPEGFLD